MISLLGTESRDATLSVFHACPLPPRTGCISHLRDALLRKGGVRVCAQASPPRPPAPGWNGYGALRLTRSLSTSPAARPRAGLGRRRRCTGHPQAGAARNEIPTTVPAPQDSSSVVGRIESSRSPPPQSLSQGAAPTSRARTVQAASKSSAKLGSIVILCGAPSAQCASRRSAAPWLCPRRRRLRWPPR